MLRNFRSVFKSNQTPMAIVMMVVLVGMVAYLAPSASHEAAPENVIARIYGREVQLRDFAQAYESVQQDYRRQYGRQMAMKGMESFLQKEAMQRLVNKKLMEELADRRNIVVTDEEVRYTLETLLRQNPDFLDGKGNLKPASDINDLLLRRRASLAIVERDIRESLLSDKLMKQAAALVPIDEIWLNEENRVDNEKITYEFASLAPDTNAVADPGDATLSTFLKASGARFQVGLRRVIQYVAVDKASLGDAIKVDEATLRNAYESKKSQYTEIQASHILFKASTEAQFAEAQAKAQALRPKLLAGENFNKAAEALSEDPSAKGNGGRLPKFSSGAMVKPFEDAAMAMKPGEISQPVRTQFGIHLIKLEGRQEKTFEMVKPELEQQLTQERFASKAKERLEQLRKRAGERGDLGPAARTMNLKVQISLPFLSEPGTPIEALPGSGAIVSDAFKMKVGQVSEVKKVGEQYIVFRVQEERASTIPPLTEIRAKVLTAWKLEEARKKTFEKAQEALKSGNLAELAPINKKENVTLQSLGELGQHPAIKKALLETAVDGLTPALWTPEGQIWIARIIARTAPEPLTFEKRRTLVHEIQAAVSQKVLSAELTDLDTKGRLKPGFSSLWGRMNGIYINTDLLQRATKSLGDAEEE